MGPSSFQTAECHRDLDDGRGELELRKLCDPGTWLRYAALQVLYSMLSIGCEAGKPLLAPVAAMVEIVLSERYNSTEGLMHLHVLHLTSPDLLVECCGP